MRRHRGDSVFDETQYQRLRTLADSVNDTARMARTTLSLLLLVALYLALTIVASTDENLLRNGQVVLPQVGVGLSIVQSYIFAPLAFLFMHGHALFLLSVLARKVRTFEAAIKNELSHWRYSENDAQTQQRECRDWLSAFAFVQIFQGDAGISNMAKALTWLATSAIPLALLFIIDISFVRYQSHTITRIHHIIFLLDLGLVVLFHWEVFGQRVVKTPKRFGTWAKGLAAGVMVLVLIFAAHPPDGTESVNRVWGQVLNSNRGSFQSMSDLPHMLDDGPCYWQKFACRYLDLRNISIKKEGNFNLSWRTLRFARFESAQMPKANFDSAQLQGASFRSAHLQEAKFSEAHLQKADFSGKAQLQGVDFREAQLQGVDFREAQLQGVNFSQARLQGASFFQAQLQGANFFLAESQKAIFAGAHLQKAIFTEAHLQQAIFEAAYLQDVDFTKAHLEGADFSKAELQGANFFIAKSQGTNFFRAQLQGANFLHAELQGADFSRAQLQGANFFQAHLQGVNLQDAEIQCTSGKPFSLYLAWMPGAQFNFSSSSPGQKTCSSMPQQLDQCLKDMIPDEIANIKITWRKSITLKEHLKKQLMDCPKQPAFKPAENDMVFYDIEAKPGPLMDWPAPPTINSSTYLKALTKWRVEFTCQNIYRARSSIFRWLSDRFGLKGRVSTEKRYSVLKAFIEKRNDKKNCPGISAISDDDWKLFLEADG